MKGGCHVHICVYTHPTELCGGKEKRGLILTLKCHRPPCYIHKRTYVKSPLQIREDRDSQLGCNSGCLSIDFLPFNAFLRRSEK